MQLRLISTTAMKTVLDHAAEAFAAARPAAIDVTYTPSVQILRRIQSGEAYDVVVATDTALATLQQSGDLDSATTLARSIVGAAAAQDVPSADVSSVDGFRQALIGARRIAMSNPVGGGVSGAHVAALFGRLGLAEVVAPKLRYSIGGPSGLVGAMILRGEADLGIQQMPELLAVRGVRVLGPLPDALQMMSQFGIGRTSRSPCPALADAFIAHMTTPAARALMRSLGWQT